MEKSIKKIFNTIKKYVSNNILFLSYIIISLLLGIILRIVTVGFPIYFKSIIGDLSIILITALFGYFFKSKKRFNYYLIWLIFFTIISIGNTIYYVFYQSFLSIDLISTARMISDVRAAAFDKIKILQFLYIIGVIIFIYINRYVSKNNNKDNVSMPHIITLSVIILTMLLSLTLSLSKYDINSITNQRNREYIVSKYGIYIYHINDIIRSIGPHINNDYGYDEASSLFKEFAFL